VNSAFDSADGYAVLRVLCGAFFIPHVVGKITAREASVAFFKLAGLNPPQFWSYSAMVIEISSTARTAPKDRLTRSIPMLAKGQRPRTGPLSASPGWFP